MSVALAAQRARRGITDVPTQAEMRRLEALSREWAWSPEAQAMIARARTRIFWAKTEQAAILARLIAALATIDRGARPVAPHRGVVPAPLDLRLPVGDLSPPFGAPWAGSSTPVPS